jgi:hypothetical protein
MGSWLMRQSRVRSVFLLFVAALVMACTDGGPAPEPAQAKPAVEAPATVEPQPGQPNTSSQPKEVAPDNQPQPEEVVPEVPPVEVAPIVTPPYDGPPRLEVVAREVSAEETLDLCPYKVDAHGFPAISEDGATLIGAYVWFDGRDQFKDYLELTWVDAITTRVEQVYAHEEAQKAAEEQQAAEGEEAAPWNEEAEFKRVCKESEARTRKRAEQLNAELRARKWRGLEVLDALYSKPGSAQALEQFGFMEIEGASETVDEVIQKLVATDRPLEVYYHAGHFIGRVRGTKVLQDTVLPDYRQHENEFCDTAPNIAAIHFDPATKVALMTYNHHEEGCLCDDHSYFARIELSPELLAEADLRKTTKFRSAYATYMIVNNPY